MGYLFLPDSVKNKTAFVIQSNPKGKGCFVIASLLILLLTACQDKVSD